MILAFYETSPKYGCLRTPVPRARFVVRLAACSAYRAKCGMAMSEKALIPSDDRKSREIIRQTCEIALDECGLDGDQKRRVVERGGELQSGLKGLIMGLALPKQFADEEVASSFVYPPEYTGPLSIREQVERLLVHFPNLNATWTMEHGQSWYDSLTLPKWIEGPLVYLWWEVFGSYNAALDEVLDKLATGRTFYNWRAGKLGPAYLRQSELTARCEAAIKAGQPGDLLIVPSQAGLRYRGKSVRRSRVLFIRGEFGNGTVAEGCRALTHVQRYVRPVELDTDCAGDEYSLGALGQVVYAPYLYFGVGELRVDAVRVDRGAGGYGSASSLVPQ